MVRGVGWAHLQQVVCRVMQQQHQGANAQQVCAVGEGDEDDGHEVVRHLFLEILRETVGDPRDKAGWPEGPSRGLTGTMLPA